MHQSRSTERFRRTLIIDDHPLFCDALAMTLRMVLGVEDVTTAASLADAIGLLKTEPRPDAILLDLNLPDVSGLDGLVELRLAAPDVPILVVSSFSDTRVVRAAIRAGAAGFVPKHSPREAFQAAFSAIARGEVHLPDGISPGPDRDDGTSPREDAAERLAQLTKQQMRILQLICEGKLNKQIAWELSIAEATVKTHVTAIMRKLGVQSRTQAVLIAQRAKYDRLLQEP